MRRPVPAFFSDRQPIILPYVTHIENAVVVTLNQITDHAKEFVDLAKGLAVEADEVLKRTVLKANGDKITGVAPSIYYMYYPWAATIGAKG